MLYKALSDLGEFSSPQTSMSNHSHYHHYSHHLNQADLQQCQITKQGISSY
jgi:hypothetical protein